MIEKEVITNNKIKLVILDFDDTLSMTEEACFLLENTVAAKLGFEPMSRQSHQKNWGLPVEKAIVDRIPGIDPEVFLSELTKMMSVYVENGLFDVVTKTNLSVLDTLKKSGYHLAILTSRTEDEIKHLLSLNHPLSTRIDAFYHRDNNIYRKPDPRVFNIILEKFTIQPDEAVYIGDTVSDASCALGAGLFFIATLESGLRSKNDFNEVPVDLFIHSFDELPTIIPTIR